MIGDIVRDLIPQNPQTVPGEEGVAVLEIIYSSDSCVRDFVVVEETEGDEGTSYEDKVKVRVIRRVNLNKLN